MNILSKILIAASLAVVTAQTASAACYVNYRQFNQSYRVFTGAAGGSLSFAEYRRLQAGQAKVRLMERVARADGYISPAECSILRHALNRESRRIWRKKHN